MNQENIKLALEIVSQYNDSNIGGIANEIQSLGYRDISDAVRFVGNYVTVGVDTKLSILINDDIPGANLNTLRYEGVYTPRGGGVPQEVSVVIPLDNEDAYNANPMTVEEYELFFFAVSDAFRPPVQSKLLPILERLGVVQKEA